VSDPYETLGVARDADVDAIRKDYRKLARKHHPDLNPGDKAAEERFKEISRAWEVLEDPERRRNYDEFGAISLEAGFDAEKARRTREAFGSRFGTGGGPGPESFGEEFEFGDLDDLLGRFMGGRAGGRARDGGLRMRGPDVEAALELDFLDAVRGGEHRLTLGRETINVRIPPGVDTGGRLRIPGKGGPGIGGGPPGDLQVEVHVRPHRLFTREGRNLTFDLPVTVAEAVRGAKVEVPTLDGRATLTIPPGTDSGTRLRLRGKGVPDPRGGPPGDLFARVQIRVPRNLDEEAKRAVDALDRVQDREIRKELFA
jgi:curved DNA-binding protein